LAERYDIAIMSTKGQSVIASRHLADQICAKYDIPLLTLSDFDISGFSIRGTLTRDTATYTYKNKIRVIHLGLRLEDVRAHNLEPERVILKGAPPIGKLREYGATEAEIDFLCAGQRVELNAFVEGELFINFIESKLQQHGIKKLVPDEKTLGRAFRRFYGEGVFLRDAQRLSRRARRQAKRAEVPADLLDRLRGALTENPELPWDEVARSIAAGAVPEK
jgi:hypothetical protein